MNKKASKIGGFFCAEGRSRTDTSQVRPVFETGASTNSATPAIKIIKLSKNNGSKNRCY